MLRSFALPDVGEGLTEATVVDWLVAEGEEIVLNQPVCVIETAKAEVELPSPYAGRVVTLDWSLGDTVRVGETLMSFEVPDVDAPAEAALDSDETPAARSGSRQPLLVGYGVDEDASRIASSRTWLRSAMRPQDNGGRVAPRPPPLLPTPAPAPTRGDPATRVSARPLATPPVRKLAKDLGVDLSAVSGSGPDGRVLREDVRAAANGRVPGPDAPPLAPAHAAPAGRPAPGDVIAVRGARLRIAQKMTVSRSTIPEATCGLWVDFSSLVRLRDDLRASLDDAEERSVVTPFALLMRLVVLALNESPILNSSYDERAAIIRLHPDVDLGIAANTANGVLVPVVRRAQLLTTLELSREIARLAPLAREGRLAPDELSGSTFTVSNFGSLGLDDGTPVINYPEAAILGVGAIKPRPVVVDGLVVARPTAKLVCSFDHRVCDGADVGHFLQQLQRLVEEPARALLRL